jgi:hypothetical protein
MHGTGSEGEKVERTRALGIAAGQGEFAVKLRRIMSRIPD